MKSTTSTGFDPTLAKKSKTGGRKLQKAEEVVVEEPTKKQ